MSGFPDRCECGQVAEYAALLEGDEDPCKSVTKYVCADCLDKHKASLIEAWTWAEWVNQE